MTCRDEGVRGRAVIALAALAAFAPGCAATRAVTETAAEAFVSPEQELELGQQVAQQVEQQYPRLEDASVQEYVRRLGGEVAKPSEGQRALPVQFTVVDAPGEVNAFAIPGGNIYVMSGLLRAAKTEAELAGVLAHEVGHVTKRHVAQQLVTKFGLSAVAAAALGQSPGLVAQIVAAVASEGAMLTYGRSQETEADEQAVQALAKAGITAQGLQDFFERLAQSQGDPGVLKFLSTHPAPGDRAREVAALAAQLGAMDGREQSEAFVAAQRRLQEVEASRPSPRG